MTLPPCSARSTSLAVTPSATRREPRNGTSPGSPTKRAQAMRRVNPAVIARNHRVEQALRAAVEREDFAPFSELLAVLSRPYEEQGAYLAYAAPAQAGERILQTFCGT